MAETRKQHRSIIERWVITGKLILETPAHFGNGDADALTDMPLLMDEVSGKPLLLGTSIAGALRNHLRLKYEGYGMPEPIKSPVSSLFGGTRGDDEGSQSLLITFDAIGRFNGIELRDGVAISPETRTAEEEKKFDFQLLAAGTSFDMRFELLIPKDVDLQTLRNALADALHALQDGKIFLGARKQRGFGQCKVENWQVWKYDLSDCDQFLAWLASERDWNSRPVVQPVKDQEIIGLLDAKLSDETKLKQAHLTASFAIDGTMMIRSGFGEADSGPDMVHLHSHRPEKRDRVPVIPGTSWAGVLRHRALKIARTLSNNSQAYGEAKELLVRQSGKPLLNADVFVDLMFGPSEIKKEDPNTHASRVAIRELTIEDATSMVITRVKIDRFTGGALELALFSEEPAVGKPETTVQLNMTVQNPSDAETGLLLLLLKDLWTGNLPVGGESGVGRGRLKGISAILKTPVGVWEFGAVGDGQVDMKSQEKTDRLEQYVEAFNQAMKPGGGQ